MRSILLCILLICFTTRPDLIKGQPVAGECEATPYWTVDGRNVMNENRGNVTLVALMELHCSFCRSQIEGFVALSKMLKNQSVNEVQFVIVAPWNESKQHVDYFRSYLAPTGIKVLQETTMEPVWSRIKGNKDDFFVYDACGRLSYYIPYPQSYLYYHYTVSTLYSTLRQEKCGSCRFVTALKVRAYLNVMAKNATTHYHYLEPTPGPDGVPLTPDPTLPPTSSGSSTPKTHTTKRKPIKDRRKGKKTTTTTTMASVTWPEESGEEFEPTLPSSGGGAVTTAGKMPKATPKLVDVVSEDEEGTAGTQKVPTAASFDTDIVEPATPTAPSSKNLTEGAAQIPATTVGTVATAKNGHISDEDAEYEDEYDEPTDSDRHLNGGGAVGSVGAAVVGVQRKIIRKRLNGTKATKTTVSSFTTTPTTTARSTTTMKPITTSWSSDPNAKAATESGNFDWRPSGTTRVPKLPDDVDCTPYTTSMCYRQWQEFGTLHSCCQRGVYLTDVCKAPLCSNATFHLCCFQKYQQARFQCCFDNELAADRPDDFSRCCYNHFVFDDDGNGDSDDQCCPKAIASYFWTTQTRVAELCLPNVELDLEGIVLEARMTDKSLVKIALQDSTALKYECPYVNKRLDFFYFEPDNGDDGSKSKSTTAGAAEVDVPE